MSSRCQGIKIKLKTIENFILYIKYKKGYGDLFFEHAFSLKQGCGHSSVVMTVFSCGIFDFFSFLLLLPVSPDTSHGEMSSKASFEFFDVEFELKLRLEVNFDLLEFLLLLVLLLLFLLTTGSRLPVPLVTSFPAEDNDRVTGWLEAKDVS